MLFFYILVVEWKEKSNVYYNKLWHDNQNLNDYFANANVRTIYYLFIVLDEHNSGHPKSINILISLKLDLN